MSALDALASEAEASRPLTNGDGQHVESLEQEESAGGPPMPASGVAGAATKPILEQQREQQQQTSQAAAVKLGMNGGAGDAAMASLDDRLVSDFPHTNGHTGTTINGLLHSENDNIPAMSVDVDQPAAVPTSREQQMSTEAFLPPPGNLDNAAPSIQAINSDDSAQQSTSINPASLSNILSSAPATASPAPLSVSALPDEPMPLPSQLHHDTAPTATDSAISSSYPPTSSVSQPQEPPVGSHAPQDGPKPIESQSSVPSGLGLPGMEAASVSAAGISPSMLAKRPFEPDDSAASRPFQDALNVNSVPSAAAGMPSDLPAASLGEPEQKRARLSPSPYDGPDNQQARTLGTAPDPEHLRQQIGSVHTAQDEQQLRQDVGAPESLSIKAEISTDADADADAADVEEDAAGEVIDPSVMIKQENTLGGASGDASLMIGTDVDHSMNADASLDASAMHDQSALTGDVSAYGLSADAQDSAASAQFPTDAVHETSATPAPQPIQAMPKEQIKYALSSVRGLKKRTEAPPFNQPVDPVALGIPHYADIINYPMDLSTVERKLQNHQYASADDFAADMRLVWNNCYTFNGREAAISQWAATLESTFERQFAKMPTIASLQAKEAERIANREALKEAAKRSQSPMGRVGSQNKKARRASTAAYDEFGGEYSPRAGPSTGAISKSKSKKVGSTSLSASTGPMSGLGMGGMSGMGSGPPGSAQFQLQQLQLQQQAAALQIQQMQQMAAMQQQHNPQVLQQEQLNFCKEIMKELFQKKHSSFAHVFYEPVDYMALGIPDYPKIIRRPMDLGTMRRKLDNGVYASASAFESDFKLLLNNCFTFNPAGNPVHNMGLQLQRVFYTKWGEMPQMVDEHAGGWGGGFGNNYGGGFGGPSDFDKIAMMQKQIEMLTGNLEMMRNQANMSGSPGMNMSGMPNMGGMPYAASPPLYGGPSQMMGMQQQLPAPVAAPKPQRPAPAPRPPKPAPAPKRKPSDTYAPPSSLAQVTSAPKPRTTKNSKAVAAKGEIDIDYHPPIRGLGNGSDYEEDGESGSQPAVTFDMKKELAEKIQEFDGDKLDKVVEIIRNSAPDLLGAENQEIELDIDMLDQRTLLKLFEYVVRPVGKGRILKPKKNKPKGRNRGVDEVAEEERINALQATLDRQEANAAGLTGLPNLPLAPPVGVELPNPGQQAGRGDVASSSSDEDDDGPDSDSDSDNFAPSP